MFVKKFIGGRIQALVEVSAKNAFLWFLSVVVFSPTMQLDLATNHPIKRWPVFQLVKSISSSAIYWVFHAILPVVLYA